MKVWISKLQASFNICHLGFVDIEEKFNEFFQKFETLEEDKGSLKVMPETSCGDVAKDTNSSDFVEYFWSSKIVQKQI